MILPRSEISRRCHSHLAQSEFTPVSPRLATQNCRLHREPCCAHDATLRRHPRQNRPHDCDRDRRRVLRDRRPAARLLHPAPPRRRDPRGAGGRAAGDGRPAARVHPVGRRVGARALRGAPSPPWQRISRLDGVTANQAAIAALRRRGARARVRRAAAHADTCDALGAPPTSLAADGALRRSSSCSSPASSRPAPLFTRRACGGARRPSETTTTGRRCHRWAVDGAGERIGRRRAVAQPRGRRRHRCRRRAAAAAAPP